MVYNGPMVEWWGFQAMTQNTDKLLGTGHSKFEPFECWTSIGQGLVGGPTIENTPKMFSEFLSDFRFLKLLINISDCIHKKQF
jgi:hypothetical protein